MRFARFRFRETCGNWKTLSGKHSSEGERKHPWDCTIFLWKPGSSFREVARRRSTNAEGLVIWKRISSPNMFASCSTPMAGIFLVLWRVAREKQWKRQCGARMATRANRRGFSELRRGVSITRCRGTGRECESSKEKDRCGKLD